MVPFTFSRTSLTLPAYARGLTRTLGIRTKSFYAPWVSGSEAPDCRLRHWYRNLYHSGMKTTLDLNDQLLADAKALAAQQRTTLTRRIEEGLQLRLRARSGSPKAGRVRLPVFKGRGGLVDGVNPLSNKALLKAIDDDA